MVPKAANAIPQPLPPSVEEAYRRKCCQIRHRYNQIEESNDAARLRLHRLRRQLDKLRVERAFLLEQIAKRTSTNVEDSDGSPSPPPTPKDKPLRTKRGHRKPSMIPDLDLSKPAGAILSQSLNMSPASESFSHTHQGDATASHKPNGTSSHKPPKKPANAFEIYCRETRPLLVEKNKDAESFDPDVELARGWKDLPENDRDEFQGRYEEDLAKYQKDKEEFVRKEKEAEAKAEAEEAELEAQAEAEAEAEGDGDGEGEHPSAEDLEMEQEVEPEAEIEKEKEKEKLEEEVEVDAKEDAAQDEDVEMADSEEK